MQPSLYTSTHLRIRPGGGGDAAITLYLVHPTLYIHHSILSTSVQVAEAMRPSPVVVAGPAVGGMPELREVLLTMAILTMATLTMATLTMTGLNQVLLTMARLRILWLYQPCLSSARSYYVLWLYLLWLHLLQASTT